MRWTAADNYEDMSQMAATRMFEIVSTKLRAGDHVNIGLATGITMIRLYEILATMFNDAELDLSNLSTFNLDEYVGDNNRNVPPTHPLSYRKYMAEKLFDLIAPELGFAQSNMFFPDAQHPAAYDEQIIAAGGLDFQLLGIGFNGHIAFNEPIGADAISANDFAQLPSRVIELNELTIRTNAKLTADNKLAAVPRKAVTMGMASILNAEEILLLACFKEQAAPLRKIKAGHISPETPASLLLSHSDATIIYTADTIHENFN